MTKRTWTRTILILAVTTSMISGNMLDYTTSTESSADYLRKVMIELRDLNLPTPSVPVFFDVDDKHYLAGKRFSNSKRLLHPVAEHEQHNSAFQTPHLKTTGKKLEPVAVDQTFAETATNNQYYQIPGPVVVSAPQTAQTAPEVSPLTNTELETMYKNTIGKGSAVSLNALANVLRSRLPTVPPNPVENAAAQPVYSYYFYPLKTFMNDMRFQNDLQAAQNMRPQNTGLMEETQKQTSNPLFMAISGFVGMALLFMVGVLLLPRFVGDFSSRITEEDDDFLDLTKTITEAIEKQNCTEHSGYKRIDKRTASAAKPMKRPSSVVVLSNKPVRQKNAAKRRRKIQRNCKAGTCKKSHLGATT